MTVYVDDVQHKYGSMLMCHMWADSLEELLAMADRIGVNRKWIQGHKELSTGRAKNASWLHFDIAQSKKALAVQYGAKRTDKYGPTEFLAKIVLERGDPRFVGKAQETLNSIARARAMPKA